MPYGFDKAKITLDALRSGRANGRLVLVSAIAPQAERMDLVNGAAVHAPGSPGSTTSAPA